MVAGRKEDMRDGGRGGGRGEAVRQSRRSRGLPPEEQKDLEEVIRETRKARVAKLKAAQEEKERSSAEDQPTPEPAVQDAHQVSKDGDSESQPTRPEAVEGESVQDEPAQASEGDADPEVPPYNGPGVSVISVHRKMRGSARRLSRLSLSRDFVANLTLIYVSGHRGHSNTNCRLIG
jgi:hypothetical protein